MHVFTYGTLMIPSHKYYFTEDCFAGDVEKPDLGGQARVMRSDWLLRHRILFGGKGMGKGDRRTRRGKVIKGSYGKSRPRKKKRGKGKRRAA